MVPLNQLTADSILSEEIFTEVFDQEDEIYRSRLILSLVDRAKELGVKGKFEELVKAYKKVEKQMIRQQAEKDKAESRSRCLLDNWTNFTGPYPRMQCKTWIASDAGIYQYNPNPIAPDILACYHPILPVERMKNLETGEEKIKLAYRRSGRWEEIIVPKTVITSANKIVSLSSKGVAVTSENAKHLVRYLSDVENLNDDHIDVQYSSSKLGWIKDGFLPYDTEIIFDGNSEFVQTFEAIREHGSRDIWFDHVKKLRKSGYPEIKLMLAASFASVLVARIGALPFFMDLWGLTGGGKTVMLMLAASVWANPDEHAYIKDYAASGVGLEVVCDLLNHLPLILDDTSKKDRRIEENFESLIYNLCSGKGKTRSNRDLGLNRESHWKNCILTNGEYPLNSYVSQGGAFNRILEVECKNTLFKDPQYTLELIKANYGFAGREFIEIIKCMPIDELRAIQRDFQTMLQDDSNTEKQAVALSVVLTADKIATERLFKDGQYISLSDAKETMIDRTELSDNERCYRYILDKAAMNGQRFDETTSCEKWGILDKESGYIIFFNQAFDELCQSGGFSRKAFLSWAGRNNLIMGDNKGNPTRQKKVGGRNSRCVFLKMDDGIERDKDGFMQVDEDEQGRLPFN